MNWRDLFYFSKGERRALTVLLCLITAAWLTLMLTDNTQQTEISEIPVLTQTPDSSKNKSSPGTKKVFTGKKTTSQKRNYPTKRKFTQKQSYPKAEKLSAGSTVELNSSDTTLLKKIPGIGSSFARRIIRYRDLLGGFYSVNQLSEVYGIDENKYISLKDWFTVNPQLIQKQSLNHITQDKLYKHPYINRAQERCILQQQKQKGKLSGWENFILLEEFTEQDIEQLSYYFSFE